MNERQDGYNSEAEVSDQGRQESTEQRPVEQRPVSEFFTDNVLGPGTAKYLKGDWSVPERQGEELTNAEAHDREASWIISKAVDYLNEYINNPSMENERTAAEAGQVLFQFRTGLERGLNDSDYALPNFGPESKVKAKDMIDRIDRNSTMVDEKTVYGRKITFGYKEANDLFIQKYLPEIKKERERATAGAEVNQPVQEVAPTQPENPVDSAQEAEPEKSPEEVEYDQWHEKAQGIIEKTKTEIVEMDKQADLGLLAAERIKSNIQQRLELYNDIDPTAVENQFTNERFTAHQRQADYAISGLSSLKDFISARSTYPRIGELEKSNLSQMDAVQRKQLVDGRVKSELRMARDFEAQGKECQEQFFLRINRLAEIAGNLHEGSRINGDRKAVDRERLESMAKYCDEILHNFLKIDRIDVKPGDKVDFNNQAIKVQEGIPNDDKSKSETVESVTREGYEMTSDVLGKGQTGKSPVREAWVAVHQ